MQLNTFNTQGVWRLTGALREPLPRRYRYIRERRRYYWIKASYPVFPKNSPIGAEINQIIQSYVKQMRENTTLPDNYKPEPLEGLPYFLIMVNTVSICRRGLVSMYFDTILYSGGANEIHDILTINFALVNGKAKQLNFDDLVRSEEDGEIIIRRHALPRILDAVERRHRRTGSAPSLQLAAQSATYYGRSEFSYDSFVLTPTAIMWVLPPGDVDAYAFGVYPIKVPYAEIQHRLRVRLDL
ncbi:MAG: DUF3298 and DUF4163 domain-containing protein [Fimbriimonadales bacterium]|nr:DUF3298 and DUF4163 domain-containing protein [Fimbriimonadales bacterium]